VQCDGEGQDVDIRIKIPGHPHTLIRSRSNYLSWKRENLCCGACACVVPGVCPRLRRFSGSVLLAVAGCCWLLLAVAGCCWLLLAALCRDSVGSLALLVCGELVAVSIQCRKTECSLTRMGSVSFKGKLGEWETLKA
jgi:hypothetical protein